MRQALLLEREDLGRKMVTTSLEIACSEKRMRVQVKPTRHRFARPSCTVKKVFNKLTAHTAC